MQEIDRCIQQINAFESYIAKLESYGERVYTISLEINNHITHKRPLREETLALLGQETQAVFLNGAMIKFKDKAQLIKEAVYSFRSNLANNTMAIGLIVTEALNFPTGLMRDLEEKNIINPFCFNEEVLPHPGTFLKHEIEYLCDLFPFEEDGSLNTPEEIAFANYLQTVHNPWAVYAKP